jgi:prolyl oligopeptidase
VYDLWQDEEHERGVWGRVPLEFYVGGDSAWEPLLDIDALAKIEGESWVFIGAPCAPPRYTRCLVRLSRGGGNAAELREFDVEKKDFVEDGFVLSLESGSSYAWKDANTLYVVTNFGEGTTTQYGYPRVVRVWTRGTPIEKAEVLFEADSTDLGVRIYAHYWGGRSYLIIIRRVSGRKRDSFAVENGRLIELDFPKRDRTYMLQNQFVLRLLSDWTVGDKDFRGGAIVSIDYDEFLRGSRDFTMVVEPDELSHVAHFEPTESCLLIEMIRRARTEPYRYCLEDGQWTSERIAAENFGYIWSANKSTDHFFISREGFLTPRKLCLIREDGTEQCVQSLPALFDSDPFVVGQYEATSRDGTHIPYFIVHARDMVLDGNNHTLLYGYGGFEISLTPTYLPEIGTAWLEHGGVYVSANIRGGGAFGPRWHRAAVREKRQRAFDDFIAVAEDLVARGITSPEHLGIMGRSNGGLLVGAVFVQRPDLFNAVACLNPVLDMKRFHRQPPGGNWIREYGNPDDPDDWRFLKEYSPYHNLRREEDYPKVLFVTSQTDDAVHPGHARKMAAKMEAMGHEVYFYEPEEGGHGGANTTHQKAFREALIYSYLLDQLR